MTFDEVLAQIKDLLQREKRVSYRGLKRRFALDDEYLEDLKEELIGAKRLATDEDGRFLVWRGEQDPAIAPSRLPSPQSPAIPSEPRPPEAERRQLTVEFIDLVGSTQLSAQLDPEEYREVVRAYQQASAGVIERFEGHIAQYLGDGLLVYFGYPAAHEDDAARAVRVGLRIIEAVHALKTRLVRPLQVRIGIHTGLVVVGEMGGGRRQEQLALGETPNLAARIQGQAEPDTVFLSAATYRLIEGLFDCEDRGQPELKGVSTPLTLYRVAKEEEAQSRFEVAMTAGLTPQVGRDHELGLLRERWEKAKEGEGQAVLLSGEPGIGKSRLVQELKVQLAHEGATRIEFRCSPYHQNSALYPIIDHLQRFLRFAREDSPAVKLEKLQHTLSHYRFPQADTPSLLAALLSLPHPEGSPPLTMSPQKQKEKTQAALVAWLIEEAEQAAVFCAWEDLHWADPSTLEVLTLLLNQVPTTRLLVLLTFRPEFTSPWGNRSHLSQMTLSRLGRPHVEAMVERVAGGKTLPAEVVQQIVAKTDGVPLFVEELTKTVVESGLLREEQDRYVRAYGGAPIPPLAIPTTLQDSLMARLDRLAPVKEIAQLGATLGREFSYELLNAVSPVGEGSLQQSLRQLVEAELLYQRGLLPHATYLFKHALIQDTAYHSLLKSKRQQYHQQIARVLEEQFPDTTETQPELVAHHYTEAGLVGQAIPYWQRAAQNATDRSANVEAIRHLTKGLELLSILPEAPDHPQQELTLQLLLGVALMATRGYATPEVERTYARVQELCQQLGETPQLFLALPPLRGFRFVRGELQTAREMAEQHLLLAQRVQHPVLQVWASYGLGETLLSCGELTAARTHLEQSIASYDPQQTRAFFVRTVQDPGVACLTHTAMALWYLGYPAQALKRVQEARTLAQELAHPFSFAWALSNTARHHQLRHEGALAQEWAEAGSQLAREQGFPSWLAANTIVRGWALAEQGQSKEGSTQILQGMSGYQATGVKILLPYYFALLAEVQGKEGQTEEGLSVLAEALALVDKTGERFYEAELYRMKGTLTLQSQVPGSKSKVDAEAEEYFLKAIEIARGQSAKSWELRAATSLARLWQRQGNKVEAHQLLSEIYGWFTEGFDTKDLQEAKRLIEELS